MEMSCHNWEIKYLYIEWPTMCALISYLPYHIWQLLLLKLVVTVGEVIYFPHSRGGTIISNCLLTSCDQQTFCTFCIVWHPILLNTLQSYTSYHLLLFFLVIKLLYSRQVSAIPPLLLYKHPLSWFPYHVQINHQTVMASDTAKFVNGKFGI